VLQNNLQVNAFFTRKEREYLARFRQLERQIAALSQLKLVSYRPKKR
jgi:hypothetical protein